MMDVEEFAASSRPVQYDDLDLANAFRDRPLSAEGLRCLRYMHDIESHTVCYLRDLLLTESHRDPRITTFLTTWAWEEQWHGVALAQVLAAHGETAGNDRIAATRSALGFKDRLGPPRAVRRPGPGQRVPGPAAVRGGAALPALHARHREPHRLLPA